MEVQDIPNLLKRGHPKPKASVAIYKLQFTNLLFTSHLFISSSSSSQAEQHLALCTPWCPSTAWNRRDLIQCLVGQTFPGQRARKDSITVEIRHSQRMAPRTPRIAVSLNFFVGKNVAKFWKIFKKIDNRRRFKR